MPSSIDRAYTEFCQFFWQRRDHLEDHDSSNGLYDFDAPAGAATVSWGETLV